MIFTSALSHIEKVFHDRYDLSSTIRHRGERGRQRENDLLLFLRENLPQAYGVATGEIISFKGDFVSPQCDLIIYDQLRMPILGRHDAVQQVPLEAVYAVIECKSSIDTKALSDAKDKFTSIRAMPRCAYRSRVRKGMVRGPFFELFGYRLRTSPTNCTDFMVNAGRDSDVGCSCLNSGCGIWVGDRAAPLWLQATERVEQRYGTLVLFYVGLLESLRSIDLGNPRFLDMLLTFQ